MDLKVEATVHLSFFPRQSEVREILRSHGFKLTDLSGSRVRVQGSWLELKAAKTRLEQLLPSQTQTVTSPSSSFPDQMASGAVSRYSSNSSVPHWDGKKNHPGYRDKPPQASLRSPSRFPPLGSSSSSSHPQSTSPLSRDVFPPKPAQNPPPRAGSESFAVSGDVFKYAQRIKRRHMEDILEIHNVHLRSQEVGDCVFITVNGRGRDAAVGKLKSLFDDLSTSLHTQDVQRGVQLGRDGAALLKTIQQKGGVYNSVLVCETPDRLRLIGPSGASHHLKKKLLGR